jgi:3-hydroxyisobutyrate dehydrogenase
MATIAFIGLGHMGLPMARNLVKAGHKVQGFDVRPPDVALDGALSLAASNRAALKGAETVITMLPAGPQVGEAFLADGILAHAQKGALLIDCSTIDVKTAREVAAEAQERGFLMVDAPVSGGVGGAEGASLTFMVGGEKAGFERAKPVLEAMGKKIVHTGASGNGQAAKICNNMILAISMIAVSEAFVLAEKLGLSHQTLFDVASTSSGQCWSLTSYCPVPGPVPASPANRDYKAGFTAAMMLKDLRLAQAAAGEAGVGTPLGAEAATLYALLASAGKGHLDFSSIIKLLRGDLNTSN